MEAPASQTRQPISRPFDWDAEFDLVWTNLKRVRGKTLASLVERVECLFFGEIHEDAGIEAANVAAVNSLAGRCVLITEGPRLARTYQQYGLASGLIQTAQCWASATTDLDAARDKSLSILYWQGKAILTLNGKLNSLGPSKVLKTYVEITLEIMKAVHVKPLPSVKDTKEFGEWFLEKGGVKALMSDQADYWSKAYEDAIGFFGDLSARRLKSSAVNILRAALSAREMDTEKICLFAGADHFFSSGPCPKSEASHVKEAAGFLRKTLTQIQLPTMILFPKTEWVDEPVSSTESGTEMGKDKEPTFALEEGGEDGLTSCATLIRTLNAMQGEIEKLIQGEIDAPLVTSHADAHQSEGLSPETSPRNKGKEPQGK